MVTNAEVTSFSSLLLGVCELERSSKCYGTGLANTIDSYMFSLLDGVSFDFGQTSLTSVKAL